MIRITFFQNSDGQYTGFDFRDHSGYAEAGSDIVCAAVSALVINTVNSIEQLTTDHCCIHADESHALIRLEIDKDHSPESDLLIRSLVIGITELEKTDPYRNFIDVIFEEV